jgi:hypothetical protein
LERWIIKINAYDVVSLLRGGVKRTSDEKRPLVALLVAGGGGGGGGVELCGGGGRGGKVGGRALSSDLWREKCEANVVAFCCCSKIRVDEKEERLSHGTHQ